MELYGDLLCIMSSFSISYESMARCKIILDRDDLHILEKKRNSLNIISIRYLLGSSVVSLRSDVMSMFICIYWFPILSTRVISDGFTWWKIVPVKGYYSLQWVKSLSMRVSTQTLQTLSPQMTFCPVTTKLSTHFEKINPRYHQMISSEPWDVLEPIPPSRSCRTSRTNSMTEVVRSSSTISARWWSGLLKTTTRKLFTKKHLGKVWKKIEWKLPFKGWVSYPSNHYFSLNLPLERSARTVTVASPVRRSNLYSSISG